MARSSRQVLLCVCLALLPGACAIAGGIGQQVSYYKWRDAHGTVHVTAEPPAGHGATELKVPEEPMVPSPGSVSPPAIPEVVRPSPEVVQAQEAYRRRSCRLAREEIMRLDREGKRVTARPGDAAARLAAQQRSEAQLRARQRMLQFCGH